MKSVLLALVVITATATDIARATQLLPTPRDGDIRTVYWELQNRSEIFLTLELKTPDGKAAPVVTVGVEFPGKIPKTRPQSVEMRAYAGALWAPRVEFWLALDGTPDRIDLVTKGWCCGLVEGVASNYWPASVSLDTLNQIADAERVSGNALGFDFVLSDSQLAALRAFRDRVMAM